jgi:hypothetical protein
MSPKVDCLKTRLKHFSEKIRKAVNPMPIALGALLDALDRVIEKKEPTQKALPK